MKIFLTSLLIPIVTLASPNPRKVIDDLTLKSIVVRTGPPKCKAAKGVDWTQAGGRLEQEYANGLASLAAKDLTADFWKKATQKDCQKDCSCAVWGQAFDRFPAGVQTQISKAEIESKLGQMTDEDYVACWKLHKNPCADRRVVRFLKSLSNGGLSR